MHPIAPFVLTALLASAGSAQAAQTPARKAPAASPATILGAAQDAAQDAALRQAEAVGEQLFRHDRAAWVASDTLMGAARGRTDPRVQGWITETRSDGGIDVTFVDATPAALYRVTVDAQGQPAGPVDAAPAALTPSQLAAAQARAAALATAMPSCSGFYNPVVLPGVAPGSWIVYLLPGSPEADVVPLGGAWRIEVRDGQPTSHRAFTQTCIALDNGEEGDAFVVSHLLDPVPTEVHVFWSRWAGKPMYVTTEGHAWAIEDGRIRAVPAVPGGAPTAPASTPVP